jgi:hypothetical protein
MPKTVDLGDTERKPLINYIILLKELFDISLYNEIYQEASMSRALVLIWYYLVFNKHAACRGNPSSNSSFLARQIWRSLKLANASG